MREHEDEHLLKAYLKLPEGDRLSPDEFARVAVYLMRQVRDITGKWASQPDRRLGEEGIVSQQADPLKKICQEMAKDLMQQNLQPSLRALRLLLACFRQLKMYRDGRALWTWIRDQDEQYSDQGVYGAAIELLVEDGAPLTELEQIYNDALSRFPGNFFAYHLSPEAVVADREQRTTLTQVPVALLHGLISARHQRGAKRDAYLGLDAIVRLYPDGLNFRLLDCFADEERTPTAEFFRLKDNNMLPENPLTDKTLFRIVHSRPLSERYTLFAMASRSGQAPSAEMFKAMMTSLQQLSHGTAPWLCLYSVRAMLSAVYLRIASRGLLVSHSANAVVIAVADLMTTIYNKRESILTPEQTEIIARELITITRSMYTTFSRYGATPTLGAFNVLITNIAGFGRIREFIDSALSDIGTLKLKPTPTTWRAILFSAGMCKDRELIYCAWDNLVACHTTLGTPLKETDYATLLRSAKRAGDLEYAREILDKSSLRISDQWKINWDEWFKKDVASLPARSSLCPPDLQRPIVFEEIVQGLEKVKSDLDILEQQTRGAPTSLDLSTQAYPMTLVPLPDKLRLPESEMRKVYDRLTTAPDAHPTSPDFGAPRRQDDAIHAPPGALPGKSSTNIPIGELRYENWKAMNFLLARAEDDRSHPASEVLNWYAPGQKTSGLFPEDFLVMNPDFVGLSDAGKTFEPSSASTDQAFDEIRRLRGLAKGAA